jgi:hypothetical protein
MTDFDDIARTLAILDRADIANWTIRHSRFQTLNGGVWVSGSGTGRVADAAGQLFVPDTARARPVPFITDYGTAASWSTAAADARAATPHGLLALDRPIENGFGVQVAGSAFGSGQLAQAIALGYQAGSQASPITEPAPVMMVEKATASALSVVDPKWERAFEVNTTRYAGDGRSVAGTFYVRDQFGATESIGGHLRAEVMFGATANAVFGGWSEALVRVGCTTASVVGHEIDVANQEVDKGWQSRPSSAGRHVGILLNNDGSTSFPSTAGIWIVRSTNSQNPGSPGGWWTSILIDRNSSPPSVAGDGEAIRVLGGTTSGQRYGGLAFGDSATGDADHFDYGVRLKDATIGDNAGLWLGIAHRIVWGPDKATGRYISLESDDRLFLGGHDSGRNVWPVFNAKATAPTLTANGQVSVAAVSNTQLVFYHRGTDGVTRSATLTLA